MLLRGYLTVEQVAKQLGLSEYRVRELIREKQIHVVRRGSLKTRSEDLKEFV